MSRTPATTPDPEAIPDTLDGVLQWTWAALEDAAASSKHPWHTPVVASVDEHGRPAARVVVLRHADRDQRRLLLHSDARSPKLDHLRRNPWLSWVMWNPRAKVQLRAAGPCTIHTDDPLADRQWDASTRAARRCYLAPAPPSEPADHPSPNLPEDVRGVVPDEERVRAGRPNFAVIATAVASLDWLYLHHAGHRRAAFAWDDAGERRATWLQP